MSFNLDRENNIAAKIDASGRKWVVHRHRSNGLCYTRPDPDREDAIIPQIMSGQWTTPDLLMEKINRYLQLDWDKSERIAAENARSNAYKKEHPEAMFVGKEDTLGADGQPVIVEVHVATDDGMPEAPTPEQMIQAAVETRAQVPDVSVEMSATEKEAVIQRAVDAENADIAAAKVAKEVDDGRAQVTGESPVRGDFPATVATAENTAGQEA